MKPLAKTCKVALVQAAPVLFDKAATVDKAVQKILEAGKNGAQLIVFPESFIPCYPYGMSFGFTVGSRTEDGRRDWKRYYDNSVQVPSADTETLAKAAAQAGSYVSIGVTAVSYTHLSGYCSAKATNASP